MDAHHEPHDITLWRADAAVVADVSGRVTAALPRCARTRPVKVPAA